MKLNGFQLKIIAVLIMVLDHIHQFIEGTPIIFTQLGRIVAPIFIFLAIEGFHYTSNRIKLIKRLLGFGVIMFIGSNMLMYILPSTKGIPNNIFFSIGLCLLFINLIEGYKKTKIRKYYFPLLILTFCGIAFAEGSFLILWICLVFYKFRGDKEQLAKSFIIISIFVGLMLSGFKLSPQIWIYESYQWMMVFSLPLILSYNGERGRGMKYFFYLFYPLHIWIIYSISVLIHK